ncbi:MAG TPA: hypothetical protein VF268_01485, partial [Gammaproteobacteria bacterium]
MARKLSYSFLIFLTCAFMSSPYASPESRGDHGMHYKKDGVSEYRKHHRHHDWWLKKLDLSDEQRQQIKAISDEIKPQLKAKKMELKDVSRQIHMLAMS